MQSFVELYKIRKNLHHAYFVISHKIDEFVSELKDFIEKSLDIKTEGNPDVHHLKFKTLSIDEAREIAGKEMRKELSGSKKIFIIETDFITLEAQNAFLKVFEEPTIATHFFIISPQDMLLPTLRSRVEVIKDREVEDLDGESVLKMNLKERIKKVKDIADAITDEEATKQDAIKFLNQIEGELYKKGVEKVQRELKVCALMREALYDRGAPIKMILENLVLSI